MKQYLEWFPKVQCLSLILCLLLSKPTGFRCTISQPLLLFFSGQFEHTFPRQLLMFARGKFSKCKVLSCNLCFCRSRSNVKWFCLSSIVVKNIHVMRGEQRNREYSSISCVFARQVAMSKIIGVISQTFFLRPRLDRIRKSFIACLFCSFHLVVNNPDPGFNARKLFRKFNFHFCLTTA